MPSTAASCSVSLMPDPVRGGAADPVKGAAKADSPGAGLGQAHDPGIFLGWERVIRGHVRSPQD